MTPRRESYRVFISHSSRDTWIARQIAREVAVAGAEVFLAESALEAGAEFDDEIRTFLNRADELLLLASPNALVRPYVWSEVGAAWLRGIRIVSLLTGITPAEFLSREDVPVFLKQRSLLELNYADTYFRELQRRVNARIR